jgi:PAS domain S-box-containing protein
MFLESETNLTLAFGVVAAVAGVVALLAIFLLARTAGALKRANSQLSQTEKGADHTERRMFNILNSIPVALVETDTSGRFVFANKAAHQLLGRKDAELVGLRFHSATWGITYPDGRLIPPDLLPAARALRGQTVKGFQHKIVNPNTRKHLLVSVTAMPVTSDLGEIIGSTAAMVETESLAEPQAPEVDPLLQRWTELAGELLLALDGEGKVKAINRAGAEILGRPVADIVGLDWIDAFVAEEERVYARARFQAVAEERGDLADLNEQTLVTAGGAPLPVTFRLAVQRDEQGRLAVLLGAGRPAPAAATVELPQVVSTDEPAPDTLRNFTEAAEDILWVADAETGKLTAVSQGFTRIYGFDLEALKDDVAPWMARVHADDRAAVQAAYEAAMAGEPRAVEFRYDAPGAGERIIQDRPFPIRNAEGGLHSVGGLARDITELRGELAALRESADRFRALAETAPQLAWSATAAGWCDYVSPGWTAYTGLAEARHLGLGWQDAVHRDDRDRVAAAWRAALNTVAQSAADEAGYEIDFRLRGEDGAYRWFRTRTVPRRDAQSQVVRWFAAATDVTEMVEARAALEGQAEARAAELAESVEARRKAEAELDRTGENLRKTEAALVQAQRLETVGRLTGGVAHDFNSLLNVIIGALDMIQANTGKPERVKRLTEAAMAAGRRGERLTRQLLAFSRRQEFQLETLDLAALIHGFEPLIRRALGEATPFSCDAPAELGAVRVDPVQFEAALLNLVVNAKDAVEAGGAVAVTAARVQLAAGEVADLEPGDYMRVAVTDTGVGMNPEVAGRATEPFFTTKALGEGAGLGLSQVYGFARQSGGQVQIQSQPGAGASVLLYLPVAETETEIAASPAPGETAHAEAPIALDEPAPGEADNPTEEARATIPAAANEPGPEPHAEAETA